MVEKTLNPTNQADWKKFGKQFETDFDAFENEAKIPNHEKRKKNDEVARLNTLSEEEGRVRGFLDDFVGKALRGSGYKESTILTTTRKIRTIVIGRLKDEGKVISEENVLKELQGFVTTESTKKAGKKYEAILKVLNENKQSEPVKKHSPKDNSKEVTEPISVSGEKKKTTERKKSAKTEEEKKQEIILTDAEKVDAVKFFEKEILPLYQAKREENKWTGYNNDVREFLKEQFVQTANAFNFLDGDDSKINMAWDLVGADLQSKIEAIEVGIVEAENEKKAAKKDFTLDEVYQKLKSAGADDEDVKYFFNLHKKDRQDFLLSSDEDLKLRIEKLREAREIDEERVTEDKKEEIERKLRDYGNYMKSMRVTYLKKEYDFNKTSSKMKRMFGKIMNLGNSEKELEDSRANYHEAVENYIKLIVGKEGINDQEEAEIMLNYFSVQEALNLQEEKLLIKASSDPKLLQMSEDFFGKALRGYLNTYKVTSGFLSNKASELVSKVSDSKILNFAGKMSGGMAFAVGISNVFKTAGAPYWITKSILLATSTGVKTMENKEKMDKELAEKEAKEKENRELMALEEIYAATQLNFKSAVEKVFISEANASLEYQEGKESRNKKMWLKAFGEAVKTNGKWFLIGLGSAELIKGFCDILADPKNDAVDMVNANETESLKKESMPSVPTHPAGTDVHSNVNIPPSNVGVVEAKSSMDTIVEREKEIARTLNEMKSLHKPDVLKQLSVDSKPENNISQGAEKETSSVGAQEASQGGNVEHEYNGIVLNESGEGDVYVKEGSSMKDTVAKLLIQNHEKLTEGKMGWNPDKYPSVEEWANKRAIGIVGEFTGGSHDYDKISVDSKITIDLNNPADIKIVEFVDGQDLESESDSDAVFGSENQGGAEDISGDQEEDVFEDNNEKPAEIIRENKVVSSEIKESTVPIKENITGDITEKDILPEDDVEKDMEEVRKNMGKQEALAAKRIGIDPEHYAKINQMSTAEFIAEAKRVDNMVHGGGEDSMDVASSNLPVGSAFSDDEAVNIRMGRVLDYLVRDGKIENPNQSIAETLRTVSQQDLMGSIRTYEGIFGSIDDNESIATRLNEDEVYSEYMASLIQAELKDMLGSNTDEGKVMRELATLRGVAMRDLADNELLSAFKEVTKDVVGNVEYRDNDTVGKYIVRIIRAAHDEGAIGKLRDSLAKIEVAA